MDYAHIENLVLKAKGGDTSAKEALAEEFAPLITNLSRKSFISSYEASDIKNECYRTLFKCVRLYNQDNHRFVGYATNAIKNSVNHLIRVSIRRNGAEGPGALTLDGGLISTVCETSESIESQVINQISRSKLRSAMKGLSRDEQELIDFVYLKGYSLKKYSEAKGINYSAAYCKKTGILKKMKKAMNMPCSNNYLN